MAAIASRWSTLAEISIYFGKHPVSFGDKLRKLRKDGYLKKGKHYFQIGSSTSPIRYDIEELEKFFSSNKPRRES